MSEVNKLSTTQLRHPLAISHAIMAFSNKDEPFEVLARYSLDKPLAKGSFGYVASATDADEPGDEEGNPRAVAIKKIGSLFDSPRHSLCGSRELQMMMFFDHPNVMKATDLFIPLGEHNRLTVGSIAHRKEQFEEVYIVMDMMDQTLDSFINSQDEVKTTDPLTKQPVAAHPCMLEHRCYLFYQMLLGMGYLHRCNVMHRDLKPENVLIDFYWTAKICDFGQGRGLGDGNQAVTTQADNCTQWYAAPESLTLSAEHAELLASVDRSIFHAVDVWSIGCIAAEMLLGRPLFGVSERGGIPQLKKICQTMGMPSSEDLVSLSRSDEPGAVETMKVFLSQFGQLPTESQLRECLVCPLEEENSKEEVDLILQMLRYNPRERITIEEALRHPLFASYVEEGEDPCDKIGNPEPFPMTRKADVETIPQAKNLIWGLFIKRHPEVAELIEALEINEQRAAAAAAAGST